MPLKQLFAPHLNHIVKMGRTHPRVRGPQLSLKNYLRRRALPPVPATADYSRAASSVLANPYLNTSLGDCVIAGGYHGVGVETGNANNLFTATDQQLIADYSAIGGYVPGNPSTDNGCDEITALNYWTQHGFADGTRSLGWLAVNPSDRQELTAALYLFENLFFAMDLPDQWINPMPTGPNFVWDVAGAPDASNGHFVVGVGYNANGVTIDTWGLLGTLTWGAIAKYCAASNHGGAYVMLTPDQLAKGQTKAPNGVDWIQLIKDFNSIGGHVPVPPQPAPPKPPAPHPPKPPAPHPPKPPAPHPPGPGPVPPGSGGTGFAGSSWLPPPYPAYPPPPAAPLPPLPPPFAAFGERAVGTLLKSPALGIVGVVGLVVVGVVSVVALADSVTSTRKDE